MKKQNGSNSMMSYPKNFETRLTKTSKRENKKSSAVFNLNK